MLAHPTEQRLRLFMSGELTPAESPAILRHLVAGCSECASTTANLWEELVTGREASPSSRDEYDAAFDVAWDRARQTHDLLGVEREAAEVLSRELIELPPHQQKLRLRNDARYQTLAICEALVEAAKNAVFDDASTAMHLAELAREVGESLDTKRYGKAIVADAKADAWANYANAAREFSDFEAAENALRTARLFLDEGTGNPTEKAKYLLALANVLTARGRSDESLTALKELERIYVRLGDTHMLGRVQIKKAFLYLKMQESERAIGLLTKSLQLLDPARDPRRQLIALHNLTDSLIDAGRPDEASQHMDKLRRLHAEMGDRLNSVRFRWLEGRLALLKGEAAAAQCLFEEARNAFVELELGKDVALVSLDLAEALWDQGNPQETQQHLQDAIPVLKALGVHTEALAAMAFLEHSVQVQTASHMLIRGTAAFVRKVHADPTTRFRAAELAVAP